MSLFALLLTYLFFCYPGILALFVLLIAIIYFMASCTEAGLIILLVLAIGTWIRSMLN